MCGIVGIGFLDKHKMLGKEKELAKFLHSLFIETYKRGKVSTGIAVASQEKILYMKDNLSAAEFIKTPEFNNILSSKLDLSDSNNRTLSIIGHCRLDTKGSPTNNLNNHPIVSEDIIGVHNGQIMNDDVLFDEYKTQFKRLGKVDSEIIFQLINHYYKINLKKISNPNIAPTKDAIIKASQETHGSMACALINRDEPSLLYLFRTYNPIEVLHYKTLGIVVFCSDDDYIETSFIKAFPKSLNDATKIEIKANNGLIIDVKTNSYHSFELAKKYQYV